MKDSFLIRKICLLTCHNQYESKQYFTQKFSEAMQRKGIEVSILTWPYGPVPDAIIDEINKYNPDITASFHQLPPQADGQYFWGKAKRPHWTLLLDPVFYDLELMKSPFSIISCVDRFDCELLRSYRFENTFFFPHAVERELIVENDIAQQKDFDVVMLASCYDPDHLREFWKNKYSKEISDTLDSATEIFLSDNHTTFFRATLQALTLNGIDPHEVDFDQLAYYVDSYGRGIERLQLIRSIKNAHVHVFGGRCWREEKPIADWSYYLAKQPNVTLYPSVNFDEALRILKRSKISLNSLPAFKNGTHERVFTALACGAVPFTNDNLYMREFFSDGEDILLYQFKNLGEVNGKIESYLSDRALAEKLVAKGQRKVLKNHTWDRRIDIMQNELSPILKNMIKQFGSRR